MKKINGILILFIIFYIMFTIMNISLATIRYMDVIVMSSSGNIKARLSSSGIGALVITDLRNNSEIVFKSDMTEIKEQIFRAKDMDFLNIVYDNFAHTTAGYHWYKNTISFFSSDENIFYIRFRTGKFISIDLINKKFLETISEKQNKYIDDYIHNKAIEMITLPLNSEEKETGVIVCGELKIREAIPILRSLLKDNSYYYIRNAVKDALKSMGESVNGDIIIENK